MKLTPRIERAISTAAIAHRKQKRKGSGAPYIVHPYSVMLLASEVTDDEDTLIACLFHDIIEDAPHNYNEAQMREEYGDRVTDIVLGVTKDDTIKDWHERSQAYLHKLEHKAPDESVIVSLADKCHNLHATLQDYDNATNKDAVWRIFKTGKDSQLWWYQAVLDVGRRRIPKQNSLHHRLKTMIGKLETIVAE